MYISCKLVWYKFTFSAQFVEEIAKWYINPFCSINSLSGYCTGTSGSGSGIGIGIGIGSDIGTGIGIFEDMSNTKLSRGIIATS